MTPFIGPITNSLIENIIKEFKKKEVKDKIIKNVCEPLLQDLSIRYYPYFICVIVILVLIIVLLLSILILIILNRRNYVSILTNEI